MNIKLSLVSCFAILMGCAYGSGPVELPEASLPDAGDEATAPDSGQEAEAPDAGESGAVSGCDCYYCPYGVGCRPSTGHAGSNGSGGVVGHPQM